MTRQYVITGTDTGIGKTIFAAALTSALGASYWKPIQAGLDEETDSETVLRLAAIDRSRLLPEKYRLKTPASPHYAAAIDGVTILADDLAVPAVEGPLVIEGAGGALAPINENLLFADLFARWQIPAVIVARTALGTINHSLMTIEALRSRSVLVHGIAFVGDDVADSEQTICRVGKVKRLGRLPLLETLDKDALSEAFTAGFNKTDFS